MSINRLSSFSITSLFGEFNYSLPLNLEDRVTAVIAPNGSGKTVCLRIINALFKRRWHVISSIEFAVAEFYFLDGSVVEMSRLIGPETDEEGASNRLPLRLSVTSKDGGCDNWTPNISESLKGRMNTIERYIPFVSRTGPGRWSHDRTGQIFGFQALVEEFPDRIPQSLLTSMRASEPKRLTELIDSVDCHLIETQRLLVVTGDEPSVYRGDRPLPKFAIQQKADKLKSIISDRLGQYAALSQSLDRSFPKRLIANFPVRHLQDLKQRLSELDAKRTNLMDVGILASESDEPVELPSGEIDESIGRVLSVYVDDNYKKLQSLDQIAERISLFKQLIESRFSSKLINVSRDNGFSVDYKGSDVALEKLSSGEQHQLVLFFELLFELRDNALILIDEPELSLHVSWQKRFIGDLLKIININNFDVILATHSPQLIGSWSHLAVELGAVDDQ